MLRVIDVNNNPQQYQQHQDSDQCQSQQHYQQFFGLTKQEVLARFAADKTNRAKKFTTRTISGILRSNTLTVFNGVILLSLGALIFIHAYIDTYFLAVVTCLNTLTGIIEEIRAKFALDRLALLNRKEVNVIREGKIQAVPVEEVVQDDLVAFQAGDQVVTDGILLSTAPVYLDESLLTGESDTIKKQKNDRLLSGSFCVGNSGVYRASNVGNLSYVNQLTEQAKTYKNILTPIQKDINEIIEGLTGVAVLFVILLILAGYVKEESLTGSVLSIVTVIKSLVPQGLILMSTIAFAFGAINVAKKHVLVQKLNAIESMSHLTTLCFDKTGTLGTNLLCFEKAHLFATPLNEVTKKLKLFLGAVNHKNRTTTALEQQFASIASEVIDELPFLSERKFSAVQVRDVNTKEVTSLWLGAPEALVGDTLDDDQKVALCALRDQGLRVLLFASSATPLTAQPSLLEKPLDTLAFLVLRDELRANVVEAIKFYEERHVKLKILSGDHPETIAIIAKQAGVTSFGKLINGAELVNLDADAFNRAVIDGQFFGNLTPKQKYQIVHCLQQAGEYVGMVGDGVNDILALKQANIGIAMNAGTSAARDVSDIILLKNDFTNLPALSQEGDRIIYNIKRIARLFLTKNVYCLFFILFVGFIGLDFPLNPRFITLIDFLTIGMPTALLMFMAPRLKKQETKRFLYETVKFAGIAGVSIAFFSLLVYVNFYLFHHQVELYAKTASVAAIILMGSYIIFSVTEAERAKDAKLRKYVVFVLLAVVCGLNLASIYYPLARGLLGLEFLHIDAWIVIVLASLVGMFSIDWLLKKARMTA